jgi:hypothetical protein
MGSGEDLEFGIDILSKRAILNYIAGSPPPIPARFVIEGGHSLDEPLSPEATIIIDPVDGSREIMYDKRSAWILTGIALQGYAATLKDISIAIQTEIVPSKWQRFSMLLGIRGRGVTERIYESPASVDFVEMSPRPFGGNTLANGYAVVVNPFHLTTDRLQMIRTELTEQSQQGEEESLPLIYDDQYISTGGQIYNLVVGCYRAVIDVRTWGSGSGHTLCCHPYDLCTAVLLEELGGVVVDPSGGRLEYPLDTTSNCDWLGFANTSLYDSLGQGLIHLLTFATAARPNRRL